MKLRRAGYLFGMLVAVGLTGCGSVSKEDAENKEVVPSVSEDSVLESYPITITHAFGETVLETKPEKIATISWGNQDVPLALGIVPVGVSEANYGVLDDSGLLPWTKDAFSDLEATEPNLFRDTDGIDFEAISASEPDVILAAYSGITQEEYDLLSEIAPVVAYPELPWQTFWRDQIRINATAIGMQKEGEALVTELETLIKEKLSSYSQLEGKSAAFFYFSPTDLGKFYIYLPGDPRAAYLTDLGMHFPESVVTLAEGMESFCIEVSAEHVDILNDIDIVIAYGNEELLTALQNDSLLKTMPAIANGAVALIEDGTPLAASCTPSALSIEATIDEYLQLLNEAADKVVK